MRIYRLTEPAASWKAVPFHRFAGPVPECQFLDYAAWQQQASMDMRHMAQFDKGIARMFAAGGTSGENFDEEAGRLLKVASECGNALR